jgi:hypothetical protein
MSQAIQHQLAVFVALRGICEIRRLNAFWVFRCLPVLFAPFIAVAPTVFSSSVLR